MTSARAFAVRNARNRARGIFGGQCAIFQRFGRDIDRVVHVKIGKRAARQQFSGGKPGKRVFGGKPRHRHCPFDECCNGRR